MTKDMRPNCPDPEILALHAEGRLENSHATSLLDHAAECESCRRELALLELARSASPSSRRVSDRARDAAVAAGSPRLSRRIRVVARPRWSPTPIIATLAAAACIAVAIVLILNRFSAPDTGGQKMVRTEQPPRPIPPPQPQPQPAPAPAPRPEPAPAPEPEKPEPEIPAEPEPDLAPPPKVENPPPPRPPVTRDTFATRFASVRLTDHTGSLAIRRKGKTAKEVVTGPVTVSEGDVLMCERSGSFFMLKDYPVTLMPESQIGVAFEESRSTPALVIHEGEALVDSSSKVSGWYVAARGARVRILETRAQFAASVRDGGLALTTLAGFMATEDDRGRSAELKAGDRWINTPELASVAPDPEAARKAAHLASTRPPTRTLFHVRAPALTTDASGDIAASVRLGTPIPYHADYVVRARVRTNLHHVTLQLNVEDKWLLALAVPVPREQRGQWATVEFSLATDAPQVTLLQDLPLRLSSRDRILTVTCTGRLKDSPHGENPALQVTDVQILVRSR